MKKILVVLPSPLMARNFLGTDILKLLGAGVKTTFMVVSPNPDDQKVLEGQGASWHPYFHPRRSREVGEYGVFAMLMRCGRYMRYLAGLFVHMCLTYRFNTIASFKGFNARLRQTFALRKAYLREGLPMSLLFGFPWPQNKIIYRFLFNVYYRRWQGFGPVENLVADFKPDLMVLSMIQTHMVTPYVLAAIRCNVQILGVNGSWDQPTTKGPLCPRISRIVVQNELVHDELVRYHGIDADRIAIIGWLQMDSFVRKTIPSREEVCLYFGFPSTSRYVVFAANAPRLGPHEPEVFRNLVAQRDAGALPRDVVLVCRCHPQDRQWKDRWGWANELEGVVVEAPDLGPLDHLAGVIRHASVVLASAGSINLDAVALDTPTIAIAWEDKRLPYWDRPARAYELEHLADLRESGGMAFASDMKSLIEACIRYLEKPETDALGRKYLQDKFLYRLDGMAASRLSEEIEGMLV